MSLRSPDDGWKETPGLRIGPMTDAHASAVLAIVPGDGPARAHRRNYCRWRDTILIERRSRAI